MPENTIDKDELIRQLMADRDRLFRENSRLRTAQNIAPEGVQQVHNEQLAAKDTLINVSDRLTPSINFQYAFLSLPAKRILWYIGH